MVEAAMSGLWSEYSGPDYLNVQFTYRQYPTELRRQEQEPQHAQSTRKPRHVIEECLRNVRHSKDHYKKAKVWLTQ